MNKEKVLTDFFTWFSHRNLDRLPNLLTEEVSLFFPKAQPIKGKERFLKFLRILYRQYPQLTFHVQGIIIQEDQAAVRWCNRGIYRDGEPYENEGVSWFEFVDGRINFISDFFKDTGKF